MPESKIHTDASEPLRNSSSPELKSSESLEVLFLYTHPLPKVDTIIDHVNSLTRGSRHRVHMVNMIGELPARLDLDRFDVIVIHYSITICLPKHLDIESFARIQKAPPLKALFIQDEYRHVDATVQAIHKLGIDVLFTCVPEEEFEKVYPEEKLPRVRKINVLTGYVSAELISQGCPKPLAGRPIDVGYRARRLSAWYGELGREKWRIGEKFAKDAVAHRLKCDISSREEDRIYGREWDKFLVNCRAVLGVESGASVFDFSGDIQTKVEAAEASGNQLTYKELEERFFPGLEGRIRLNQISPRCFEAAARGTLMILYEGEYSGRLKPDRHFVPLKKDHSNMAEVVRTIMDESKAQAIADQAWEEVASASENSYAAFTSMVDDVLESELARRPNRKINPYNRISFACASVRSPASRMIFLKRHIIWHYPFVKTIWVFVRRLIDPKYGQPQQN